MVNDPLPASTTGRAAAAPGDGGARQARRGRHRARRFRSHGSSYPLGTRLVWHPAFSRRCGNTSRPGTAWASGARGLGRRSCLRPAPPGPRPRARRADTGYPLHAMPDLDRRTEHEHADDPTASTRPPQGTQPAPTTPGSHTTSRQAQVITSTREPRRPGVREGGGVEGGGLGASGGGAQAPRWRGPGRRVRVSSWRRRRLPSHLPSTRASRAVAAQGVKVVRTVARSTLTP